MFQIKLNNSEVLEIETSDKKMNWYEAQELTKTTQSGFKLPSRFELELMYVQLHSKGIGNFSKDECYWSHEDNCLDQQVENNYAWVFNFNSGESNLIELKTKYSLFRFVKKRYLTVEDALQEWMNSPNHLFAKKYHKHSVQIAQNEDVFAISITSLIHLNTDLKNICIIKLFPTFSNSNRDFFQTDLENLSKLLYGMEQNFIFQMNDLINQD